MKKQFFLAISLGIIYSTIAQQPKKPAATKKPVTITKTSKPKAITPVKKVEQELILNSKIKTPSGLQVTLKEKGKGKRAEAGQTVKVHYTGTLLDGKKFDSSRDRGEPFEFSLGAGQVIKGWDEGIAMLHIGDRAVLEIPAALGYGNQDMGSIPPNSTLLFDVELVDIVMPFDLTRSDIQTTASGLKYYYLNKGNGRKPETGNRVTVHYTGYLTNGKKFDSSRDRNQPFVFKTGENRVIKAWEEGISMLGAGDHAIFICPPNIAYGERAMGPIPANSTLVFDVELLDVTEAAKPQPFDIAGKEVITTQSGLKYIICTKGNGTKVETGKTATFHYTGYLPDGKIFDSSLDRESPIKMPCGAKGGIKGLDEVLALMQAGDKFHVIIPPSLAYGKEGFAGMIGPDATLTFDVEMLKVE
jgi:peptidylprolyl isomerase